MSEMTADTYIDWHQSKWYYKGIKYAETKHLVLSSSEVSFSDPQMTSSIKGAPIS